MNMTRSYSAFISYRHADNTQEGRSGRILAGDPAKAREGILRDEECFCEERRFGSVRKSQFEPRP